MMQGSVEILYVSREIAVCYKPPGVLSQQGSAGQESMLTLLKAELGGDFYPVHRLDRETSGVMVYARTPAAAASLSQMIQQGRMKKEYLAVVQGEPDDTGVMEDLLFHDKRRNKSYVVQRKRSGVKAAKLAYRVLSRQSGRALVQVRLFTGRTHQIRVQFASRGMPLCGDGRYGGGAGALALSAVRLGFPSPATGKWAEFARVPEELGGFTKLPPLQNME